MGFTGFEITTTSALLQILGILSQYKQEERKSHNQNFKAAPAWIMSISISIFYFCSATIKTERNKQTYRTIAEEEKGRSNKMINIIACTQ